MDFQTLKLELQKRCRDLGQMTWPDARYGEALNNALDLYPRVLWPLTVDGSTLDTVEDQYAYALSGLSDITEPWQVRRVWIDDTTGTPHEIGRYEVQDNAGSLSLVLDEAPSGAYDITLEYATSPDTMSGPTDTTQADDDWLLAKAMVSLLGEADWAIKDPQQVLSQLEYWNARAVLREQQLRARRRRVSRKARTTAWRTYV
jgi:hypothetical protein